MLAALRRVPFGAQVLLSLVLGVVLGLVAREIGDVQTADGPAPNWLESTLATIGGAFVTLLRAIVPPLVFTAIVARIANLRQVTNAARLAGQTLLWFAITALIAVGIGIAPRPAAPARPPHRRRRRRRRLEPGRPARGPTSSPASSRPTSWGSAPPTTATATIGLSFNVLQIVVVAIAVGVAALQARREGRAVPGVQPLGPRRRAEGAVVGHPARPDRHRRPDRQRGRRVRLGRSGPARARSPSPSTSASPWCCSWSTRCCCAANGLNPLRFFAGAWPAIQLAFVSRSSVGTLPVTEQVVTERNLGVPREYASFAVPFGATTKMDGCAAIYPALAAIFVAQFFGVDLGLTRLPADRLRLGGRLGRDRGPHRRDRHAHADAVARWACRWRASACCWRSTRSSTWAAPRSTSPARRWCPTIVAKREGILDQAVFDSTSAVDVFADEPGTRDDEVVDLSREGAAATPAASAR